MILVLRVNGEFELGALVQGGWCDSLAPIQGTAHFAAAGVLPSDPFNGMFGDACTDGSKADPAHTFFDQSECTDLAGVNFVLKHMDDVAEWQTSFVLGGVPLVPAVWENGSSPECGGPCPTHLYLRRTDKAGHGGLGEFTMPAVLNFPLSASKEKELSPEAGADLRMMAHEFFHNLENAWTRAYPSAVAQFAEPFFEGAPDAIEGNACFTSYHPGLPPNLCISARRLGYDFAGYGAFNEFLNAPSVDPAELPYVGALLWRYAMEQYALPLGSGPGHPAGTSSGIAMTPGKNLGSVDRRPDEGADLMGKILDQFRTDPNASVLDATDHALRDHVHRSLSALMLDLHTAALLKDYKEIDDRWKFVWVGDYNAGAALTPECTVDATLPVRKRARGASSTGVIPCSRARRSRIHPSRPSSSSRRCARRFACLRQPIRSRVRHGPVLPTSCPAGRRGGSVAMCRFAPCRPMMRASRER